LEDALELKDFQHDPSLISLIEMGTRGHFPLFHPTWHKKLEGNRHKILGPQEKKKAQKILQRLSQHRGLERKKTVFHALSSEEQELFIRAFLKLVEHRILDKKVRLH
jgi:hypothetical protein